MREERRETRDRRQENGRKEMGDEGWETREREKGDGRRGMGDSEQDKEDIS